MTDNIKSSLTKAESSFLSKGAKSSLLSRGIRLVDTLNTNPLVTKLIAEMKEVSDWDKRSAAWTEIRKLGPNILGWENSLRELIWHSDGWCRIFAAESLALHSSSAVDAIPVLAELLEISLGSRRFDLARMASGAIGKYNYLSSDLVEVVTSSLTLALDSEDSNVVGSAEQTLASMKK